MVNYCFLLCFVLFRFILFLFVAFLSALDIYLPNEFQTSQKNAYLKRQPLFQYDRYVFILWKSDSMGSVSSQLQDVSRFVDQRFKKVDEDLSKVLKKVDLGSRRPSIADLLTGKMIMWDGFIFLQILKVFGAAN